MIWCMVLSSAKNLVQTLVQKFVNFFKKVVACLKNIMYTNNCCGMIAVKREVAARDSGFSVERMSS